jgi:NhaA family Na+:H+ antiporter
MKSFFSIRAFLKLESASGIILCAAALLALILDNSPWAHWYEMRAPLLFWVNEGFMTFFFLLVGLELKREFLMGELAGLKKVLLPSIAALGGMLVPALLYLSLNSSDLAAIKGWAIPVATDIAFALGVLSLFGKRVPLGLKLFLMALAIFDDVGAIIIITLFHTRSLAYVPLFSAGIILLALGLLNILRVTSLWLYLLLGFLLWVCVLYSGVHATIAGVLLAFFIPLQESACPLRRLESILHPWVAYLIMPLFAFLNAGLSFQHVPFSNLIDTISLGIVLGLVIGKQVGVFGFSWAMIKLGWARLPDHTTWLEFYGVAVLCGIGFTMSLFLGTLAFESDGLIYLFKIRLGVLLGSVLSGVMGAIILYIAFTAKRKRGMQT